MSFELRERESALVARFPSIRWLEPQTVTVEGMAITLTCRLCAALDGLKARDILAGRVGFADVEEYVDHLQSVHVEPAAPETTGAKPPSEESR